MKSRILLFLKGLAMGAADVVPGVSGGTIAFITGIYEELLFSIKSVDLKALKLLLKFDFKGFWEKINGSFLLVLFAGIGTALVTFSRVVLYLLANQPILLWSFFFGLIIASALLVAKQIKAWSVGVILALIIGTGVAFWITTLSAFAGNEGVLYVFFCGAIAICAMILPGISGSFILILLGAYEYIFGSLQKLIDALVATNMTEILVNLKVILAFMIGCVTGIISFSHLLTWLFKKYHDIIVAALIGFLFGSLNKVWPWKETVETYIDRHGVEKPLVQNNVSPLAFPEITGQEAFFLYAIGLAVLGFVSVWGIEYVSTKFGNNEEVSE
ncbi:DUF368 domain-containing protein [Flammeovirgaceae bacterium SG7u.111]|nr:DUF368 domain-containing protein [Flammeovirgaceae bacterium SG7u.132]WPO34180.1 DUF368 domain-containing protein [Flammeovirgaceae bacterium SG7u.111]